jgi:hypothetical protein
MILAGPYSGQILVNGGAPTSQTNGANSWRFNPANGVWETTPNMVWDRTAHTTTALSDGTVLAAGALGDIFGLSAPPFT